MIITSKPAGAEVYLDGVYAGTTPLDMPFSHYGTHDVTLREPKHVSVLQSWTLVAPVYEYFPLDFFTEWLLPITLVDEQRLDIQMQPSPPTSPERLKALRKRAETLRSDGRKVPAEEQ